MIPDRISLPTPSLDPLSYDRLVRIFQTTEEREKEGAQRGYTGVLERDLVRSEAKLVALEKADPHSPVAYRRNEDGSITGVEVEDEGLDRVRGWQIWTDLMGQRFMRGDDDDFDYNFVDNNEDLDDREEMDREHLDIYLKGEDEKFLGDGTPSGETGIQDF